MSPIQSSMMPACASSCATDMPQPDRGHDSAACRDDPDTLALKILDALARIDHTGRPNAEPELVEIASAQIAGVSYANIGDAGLGFLEEWAESGARVKVPAFMNPCGMDMAVWQELGISADFASKQRRIVDALCRMGVTPR